MKKRLSFLSLLLVICMLTSIFASCSGKKQPNQPIVPGTTQGTSSTDSESSNDSTENKNDTTEATEKGTDVKESTNDHETEEITEPSHDLGNIYADSIIYAEHIKNGVQAYYPDGTTRSDYVIENLDMTAEFALDAGSEQKLTYLKNKKGGTYLENTMDVFVRMANGTTFYASDSTINARSNTYRIGYYYYDVRILNQSFMSSAEVEKEMPLASELFKNNYNSKSISKFVIKNDIINYVVSGTDPYFYCSKDSIDIPFNEYDALQFTVKSTKAAQAQLFMLTDTVTSYTAANSIMFEVKPDGEFHTYTVMLSEFNNIDGSVRAFRFDLGMEPGERIEVKDIKAVKLSDSAPRILLDRTWHTYSDKLHQELHFVAPSGQTGIDAVGMITEIPESKVAKLTVKAAGQTYSSLDGVDFSKLEYIGFDIKDAGVFGYIMPYDGKGGSLTVTLENGVYTIIQEATPENGEIKSPREVGNTSNDFFMGLRIYTDESHNFDEFIKQAEWEINPFRGIQSDKYVGYNSLNGAYTFEIGGTSFNPPFFSSWNLHYSTEIAFRNNDIDRPLYFRAATTSGCLEAATLLGNGDLILPIPLEVSKNFGEKEEPVMNYGDVQFGETLFPIMATSGIKYSIKVLNLYQNWGKFPLKQLSSIAYYAPYYHLSVGVTETTCISPWYVRGRTLWTLPDFRTLSAPYWFELPNGEGFQDQPQHTSADLFQIIHYTDAAGNYQASENYQNVIDSSGPVYANVKMDYLSDDGKMHISYEHTELPQTDELRTFYTVEIDVLGDIDFKNFKNDFAFYSWDTERSSVGYLDANDKIFEGPRLENNGEYILGKTSPYFGNYGTDSKNAAHIGFVIHSYDITVGGSKFDGNFVVTQSDGNKFDLSLNLGETTLKAGDKMTLNIILVPWGSHKSTDSSNLAYIRENTCINPFKTTVTNGELISDLYMSKIKSVDGESVEFTVSGGANNAVARVYGFNQLTAPKFYELVNGEWIPYDVSSAETPDASGNRHYYDGYSVYYDGDGTYSYAFAFNMDNVESRTFKVEAKDEFTPWPDLEIFDSDPINYHTDAKELSALFANSMPGIGKAEVIEEEGKSYIRLWGDGKGVPEVNLAVFSPKEGVSSGQYLVLKYRIPSTNETANAFEFFTSTVNDSANKHDSIWLPSNKFHADSAWHVVIIDASTFIPDTFVANDNDEYFAKYIRFDVFNSSLNENEYIDVEYVGICDTTKELCELNADMEHMELLSKNKLEKVDVATGEITLVSQDGPTVTPPAGSDEGVTLSKDFASFLDANNPQGYKISDTQYFGRIDALNGFGPMGITGIAYDSKGSNTNIGVATFKFNNTTTKDYYLVFSGWGLVYGGVEKYVWSADGGKTWHDITLYKCSSLSPAGSGMINYANNAFGKTDFNLYADDSSYQGALKGHETCSGLGADLSAFIRETVSVTLAAVPKTDTSGLCILAHVTDVKVESPAEEKPDENETESTTPDLPPVEEAPNPYNDPINYYMDASEFYNEFGSQTINGIGSIKLSEDGSYVTVLGDGGSAGEVMLSVFSNPGNVATGQYIVIKYRLHKENTKENFLQFFTSTINASATAGDHITYDRSRKQNDGQWHVAIIDASSMLPSSCVANGGKYFIKYLRFDIFNCPMPAGEGIDIAYIGLSDSVESIRQLDANKSVDMLTLVIKESTKFIDTATGELINSDDVMGDLRIIYDPSIFVDNSSDYKLSDTPYFSRIDTLNGFGPNGVTDKAYDGGSDDKKGVAKIAYNKDSTPDKCLAMAGWALVYGGIEKYVWSADGGKTWNDVKLYSLGALLNAHDGMLSFTELKYGSSVDFSGNLENAVYQGALNGKPCGIAADLSAYSGQTVNVTFAAVSKADPSSICVLAHITGVNVVE